MHILYRKIRVDEWYAVCLSFLYYFSVLAAYYVMRPMRDQLAAEVGSSELPWFFTATFIATLILTPLFAWTVSNFPRYITMPLIYLFFVFCQIAFIPLFQNLEWVSVKYLGLIFFVWVSVFNLFVVSIFWSFMTDIWNDSQARRLFPIIALGGTIGAIFGPILTRSLVAIVGHSLLLLISAILLLVAVICIIFLGRWANLHGNKRQRSNNSEVVSGTMWDGLKQIFSNPFIRSMSIMMLLNDAIGTIAYALVTDYSNVTFAKDIVAQTQFAATMDLSANVIQVIVQLTITRWLLMYFGASSVFLVWTLVIVFSCSVLSLVSNPYSILLADLPWIAVVLILTRSLSYAMLQPARESLYTLVPRELRYKGKNAVDTVVWRAGDVLSLLSISGFRYLGVTLSGFGGIWALLAGLSGFIGWRLSNRVEKNEL